MNARTLGFLLATAMCSGAAVLALWFFSKSDDSARLPQRAVSDEHAAPLSAGVDADTQHETHLEAASTDATLAPTRSLAVVATDADRDETRAAVKLAEPSAPSAASASTLPRIAGKIRGSFVREGGPWTPDTVPAENAVILDLSSIEQPTEPSVRAESYRVADETGAIMWTFEFADVLAGEYLLTLSALGARRWSPTSLRVRAPLDGVVFTRFDKDPAIALAFEVVDAHDGTPLPQFDARHIQVTPSAENGVFLHTGPLDLAAFPLDARFDWSLRVESYATAFGNETAFERRGERKVAVVKLARGWSNQVFVLTRDPTAVPARGAEISLDGLRAGFTNAHGMLVVSAASEPREIDAKLAGFVRRERADSSGAYTARQRGGVTVVMLDRAR